MTIETINKRIANTKAKLEKLNAKMDRIKKAKASNYEENNPYSYCDYDYKATKKEIDAAKESLKSYKDMLKAEKEKAASRNIPVIVEFLNNWKTMAKDWYNTRRNSEERSKDLKEIEKAYKAYRAKDDAKYETINEKERQVCEKNGWDYDDDKIRYSSNLYHHPEVDAFRKKQDEKIEKLYDKYRNLKEIYHNSYEDIENLEMAAYDKVRTDLIKKAEEKAKKNKEKFNSWEYRVTLTKAQKNKAWNTLIERILSDEWNRKYDRLVDDVIRITGEITDATALRVNEKGDLDGYVIGKKGTARINTFGAGGYNIQCFHYRTKVTRVK